MLGELPAALAGFREAVRVKPDYAEAHEALGNLLMPAPRTTSRTWPPSNSPCALRPDNADAFACLMWSWQALARLAAPSPPTSNGWTPR